MGNILHFFFKFTIKNNQNQQIDQQHSDWIKKNILSNNCILYDYTLYDCSDDYYNYYILETYYEYFCWKIKKTSANKINTKSADAYSDNIPSSFDLNDDFTLSDNNNEKYKIYTKNNIKINCTADCFIFILKKKITFYIPKLSQEQIPSLTDEVASSSKISYQSSKLSPEQTVNHYLKLSNFINTLK